MQNQLHLQNKLAWDLETCVKWSQGVDLSKGFLPLDKDSLVFPKASAEQRLALSQFMGLVVNSTISEMEDSLPKFRYHGWEKILRAYPAQPELWDLGELFFAEEAKHARAFSRFLDMFCQSTSIERPELDALLPKAFGSYFQSAITANALAGGHAFWWVVASVEEVSINIFHNLLRHKDSLDPLYFQLHRRHLEEESRHANYAFLMLNVVRSQAASHGSSWRNVLHRKVDFLFSQLVGTPWVLSELHKFFHVKQLRKKHPFFEVLASCIPLFEEMPKHELIKKLFVGVPYISWLLNPKCRKAHAQTTDQFGSIMLPYPEPKAPELVAVS